MNSKTQKASMLRSLALDLIDTDERREQTVQLLDEFLPHLVSNIEHLMHEQEAKMLYEIFSENYVPKIRIVLKLKSLEHELLIHLDSKIGMFIVGLERKTGEIASNALAACSIVRASFSKIISAK
jgi:hypothetical protein